MRILIALCVALIVPAASVRADAGAKFEKQIRPILAARCYSCHGGSQTPKSGLRLDTVAGIRQGGKRGALINPSKPGDSLLIRALGHEGSLKMPPTGKLPPAELAAITAWIRSGAVLPAPDALAGAPNKANWEKHWAFRPLSTIPLPKDAAGTPIDSFVRARLAAAQLDFSPPADKRTLLRRATFDLIGLPPTPAEIDSFLQDSSPEAFAKVIDRLLASPHYGERWGRHWLDVARYADSNGMDENLVQANAWRYRDYVVAAFNRDKPFDQFICEQIAGDLIKSQISDLRSQNNLLVATGFLSLGPKMLAEDDPVKMHMDIVDEQIDTVGKVFLGMTVGCARCHDHKFDPISMADYYGLAGIFKSTQVMDNYKVVARWTERSVASADESKARQLADERIAAKHVEVQQAERAYGRRVWADLGQYIGMIGAKGRIPLPREAQGKRSLGQQADDLRRLREQKTAMEKAAPVLPEAMAAGEGKIEDVRIHNRGNHLTLGDAVPRGFPRSLSFSSSPAIPEKQSGRLQLAQWLTQNPLTARVIVNRIWHWHFGAGLVRSTDNFGTLGDSPSHPKLLDWLSGQLVADGWSIKKLHRRIMLSRTYQQSARHNVAAAETDPENRLLWRFPRQRLDAESLRDALLAVGGNLDRTMGGSLMQGGNRGYVPGYPNGVYDKYDMPRRSVYLPVIRSMLYDVFQAFDFADPSMSNGERVSTTVAPQALFALNSKLMHEQAREFARLQLADSAHDDDARIRMAYERAYGRLPTGSEITTALAFVRQATADWAGQGTAKTDSRLRAWQSLCRVLLSSNEFLYVE